MTPAPHKHRFVSYLILGGLAGLSLAGVAVAQPAPPVQVVELFTSQGCSSCPPADRAVAQLSARPDILALSFGVTYWDDLGWKDTFAQPAFTDRQWAYAKGLRHSNVATPQVVVNGRIDTVGQSVSQIDQALRAAPLAAGGPQVAFAVDGGRRLGFDQVQQRHAATAAAGQEYADGYGGFAGRGAVQRDQDMPKHSVSLLSASR